MKEFITKNKWMGFVAVLAYAVFMAVYATQAVVPVAKEYIPVVAKEVDQFLPITIENGEITEPIDTVISKTYGSNGQEAKVVLDTRVDEFETSELEATGLYISKKYIYGVSPQKTEIRSFEKMKLPKVVINSENLKTFTEIAEKSLGKYVFGGVFVFLFLAAVISIPLYTVCMHWIIAIWFKTPFTQTLFINSLTYVVLALLGFFSPINLGVLVSFVAYIAVNVGVCSTLKNQETAE